MQAMIIERCGKVPLKLADMPVPILGENDVLAEIFSIATLNITKLKKQYNVKYTYLFMKPSGEQLSIIT